MTEKTKAMEATLRRLVGWDDAGARLHPHDILDEARDALAMSDDDPCLDQRLKAENEARVEATMNKVVCDLEMFFSKQTGKKNVVVTIDETK